MPSGSTRLIVASLYFFAANRFEVVRERDRHETKDQNEANRNVPGGIRHRGKG